ncbi:MAG: AAA family ATPase [Halanaerobiales bacterium]
MKITGIRINNYKSLGTNSNYLLVEPYVTALIGKNESGKSNILEAIGSLSFLMPLNNNYIKNKNRGTFGDILVIVELEFYKTEIDEYEVSQAKTRIFFENTTTINIKGGLSDLIKRDEKLIKTIDKLTQLVNNQKVWGNNGNRLGSIKEYLEELSNVDKQIQVKYTSKLTNLKNWIINDYQSKDELIDKINFIIKRLDEYYKLLPQIYYRREDRQLKHTYLYKKIKELVQEKDHIFYRFLVAADIKEEEILYAFEESDKGTRRTIRNKIIKKIKNNIEKKFNDFYKQEEIKFQIEFEKNSLNIYVLTDDKAMNLSERSNGLRWYIGLFVDILSQDYKNTSILYLLDEPGVHLHVNAQKELLGLFKDLTRRNNQLIYTTHSPYMINNHDILNVRAIEKDIQGNTKIYKNAYNQELSKESKMETLSPLVKAIGADLKFNIGLSSENNIVTEGITDYMYITALLHYINVANYPNIIPAAGVSNISRIVSILIGWGCEFKILLDYDSAGYKEYKILVDKLSETLMEKINFVNGISTVIPEEIKSSKETIETLVSDADFRKLNNPYDDTKNTKTLSAKEFYDKVFNNEIELEQKTVTNFKKLFSLLEIEMED